MANFAFLNKMWNSADAENTDSLPILPPKLLELSRIAAKLPNNLQKKM